jgi:hypothetical protein
MEEVKRAYAWKESLDLAKALVRVCEEFSDAERNVLVWHLRQAVVDIPAGVAADLAADRPANKEAIIKLATTIELVDKIYPAIEIGTVESKLQTLIERVEGDFDEVEPVAETEANEPDDAEKVAVVKAEAEATKVEVAEVPAEPDSQPEPEDESDYVGAPSKQDLSTPAIEATERDGVRSITIPVTSQEG